MEIRNLTIDGEPRGTVLIDYGWAILGHRTRKGRKITAFNGWSGYSNTTSTHLNKLKRIANNISDKQPVTKGSGVHSSPNYDVPDDPFPWDTKLERAISNVL